MKKPCPPFFNCNYCNCNQQPVFNYQFSILNLPSSPRSLAVSSQYSRKSDCHKTEIAQRILRKYLVISIIIRTFVTVPESTINPIHSPSKTHSIMNKTWKTVLQVVSYVITLLLGGAAGNVMM